MTALSAVLTELERRIPGKADRNFMVDAINIALSEVGNVTKVDESLTVVADQTEYDLPSGVINVVRVEVAGGSSADYAYTKVFNWREINGKLYFPDELGFSAGNKIRLYYNDTHDSVTDNSDVIDDDIPVPLLNAIAAYRYAYLKFYDQSNIGVKDDSILVMLRDEMYLAKSRYRVNRLHRDPIHRSN